MKVTQLNTTQSIYISEQDIFLNEDGVPCEGTDPKRHRLLVRRGAQIPYEDVLALGLDIILPDTPILLPSVDEDDYLGAVPPAPVVEEVEPFGAEDDLPEIQVFNKGETKKKVK